RTVRSWRCSRSGKCACGRDGSSGTGHAGRRICGSRCVAPLAHDRRAAAGIHLSRSRPALLQRSTNAMKRNAGSARRTSPPKASESAETDGASVHAASLRAPAAENLLAAVIYAAFTMLLGFQALAGKFLVGP